MKLATTNDYTGATVLRGGVVEFATLKNGGEASAIGASLEFAQNWVWYGGSWNYTGGSTSSNRSATIYKDTELNIAQSGATVKMSGTLEGNGGFILNGSGTLQPTTKAFFGYEGNTVLRGGTLYLTKASELWTDKNVKFGNSPKLVLAGGALVTKDNNDTYSSYISNGIPYISNRFKNLSDCNSDFVGNYIPLLVKTKLGKIRNGAFDNHTIRGFTLRYISIPRLSFPSPYGQVYGR